MAGEVLQPIDVTSLEKYLRSTCSEIQTPLSVRQYTAGQSNPTYLLTSADGRHYVLRKKPPGKLFSKSSHQIEREFSIIRALKHEGIAVPATYCLCVDDTVIGTSFYIMEHLDGRIFRDASMPEVNPSNRRELWKAAVETLARIHRLDPDKASLQGMGKRGRYYDRQITLFKSLSESYASVTDIDSNRHVGELPHLNAIVNFLSRRPDQPADRSTVIHGDFKIDNLVFHKSLPRVIGVLDWEMATVGHPLADICTLIHPYFWDGLGQNTYPFQPGHTPGLPAYEDCVQWYAEASGWDPTPDLPWGKVFYMFRTTVMVQSVTARYARRQISKPQAKYVRKEIRYATDTWERLKQVKAIQRQNATRHRL